MRLREENVLFVDDNKQNLEEALFYCPRMMVIGADEVNMLYEQAVKAEKKDKAHQRLEQYRVLESKVHESEKYNSNDEFLHACRIKVQIIPIMNQSTWERYETRICDLVQRSNQLNYTKKRQDINELEALVLSDKTDCGIVEVSDKFGNYGIVGFFAINTDDREVIHFLFSCRTLGMRIEQYVYMKLGHPYIQIQGEVVAELNDFEIPGWINQETQELEKTETRSTLSSKVLVKGPCDMSQTFAFIEQNDNLVTEFTYIGDNGVEVEGHNHTAQIVMGMELTPERKSEIISDFSWFDHRMFDSTLFSEKFGCIVLSMISDCSLGLYRNKRTGEYVALCGPYYKLTDEKNWPLFVNKEIPGHNITFTYEELERFASEYEWVDNQDGHLTIEGLSKIYNHFVHGKNNRLILLLGVEREYENELKSLSYKDRHLIHRRVNDRIRQWAKDKKEITLIGYDKYIHSQSDFTDTINHFQKKVYYELSNDLVAIINGHNSGFKTKSRTAIIKEQIVREIKRFIGNHQQIMRTIRKIRHNR